MANWWLPADGFASTVRLAWRRTTVASSQTPDTGGIDQGILTQADPSELTDEIRGVKWVVRGGAHWLTYQEPGAGRTTLVVMPDELKWLRYGDISWQHTFIRGEKTKSSLQLGNRQLPVELETLSLSVQVEPYGGQIRLYANLVVAGTAETLKTELTFFREDAADGEPTSR